MSTFRAALWARPIAAGTRAANAARPVRAPEVPRLPVLVRMDDGRPWSPWCEVWDCRYLTRRHTPLGSYCTKHAAALAAHFGWAAGEVQKTRAA